MLSNRTCDLEIIRFLSPKECVQYSRVSKLIYTFIESIWEEYYREILGEYMYGSYNNFLTTYKSGLYNPSLKSCQSTNLWKIISISSSCISSNKELVINNDPLTLDIRISQGINVLAYDLDPLEIHFAILVCKREEIFEILVKRGIITDVSSCVGIIVLRANKKIIRLCVEHHLVNVDAILEFLHGMREDAPIVLETLLQIEHETGQKLINEEDLLPFCNSYNMSQILWRYGRRPNTRNVSSDSNSAFQDLPSSLFWLSKVGSCNLPTHQRILLYGLGIYIATIGLIIHYAY